MARETGQHGNEHRSSSIVMRFDGNVVRTDRKNGQAMVATKRNAGDGVSFHLKAVVIRYIFYTVLDGLCYT
jgi:hypothetical protein